MVLASYMKGDSVGSLRPSPLVLDGALGTELERSGIDTSSKSWTARSLITDPEEVYRIHREYALIGADILTANTFRTNPRALKDTGLDPESLTKRAVEIARKAAGARHPSPLIAGSIAPVEDCFSPELVPESERALTQEHRAMVRWLNEAGIDIILIETMNSLREALCALQAAKAEGSKATWVSVVPKDGVSMLDGTPLDHAVKSIREGGAHLVALNCAPASIIMDALPVFSRAAKRANIAFGCYPNASERRSNGTWDLHASTDERIAECNEEWLKHGAFLVGSCCHTTPNTTAATVRVRNHLMGADAPKRTDGKQILPS